jgi:metallo-beta-lactamase family protein
MVTGGRILHHMERRLPDPRNTVVLVGYQAAGTRGQSLQNGATSLKLHGHYVPIRADVVSVPAFSVHADRDELVAWLGCAEPAPRSVFVVHGETEAAASLRDAAESALGCTVVVPHFGERVRLD